MKKTKSKPAYSIYPLNTLLFKKLMLKSGNKQFKKATIPEIGHEIFCSPVANNLDKHLLVAEVLWNDDGRNIIFPGNERFYSDLLRSNFSIEGSATLNLPHSSFILAMPKGFVVDGINIPSVIVNFNRSDNRKGRYDRAAGLMKLPPMMHEENDLTGDDSLSFFYQDPYEDTGVIVQVNQTPEQVSCALQSDSPNEYARILGEMPKDLVSPIAMSSSSSDRIIQFVITKLIAGISVYMSANNIERLAEGLPNSGFVAVNNLKTDVKYSFSHLLAPCKTKNRNSCSEVIGTRRFHFRQLRDECFYKNQYKDFPRGSRWVCVKEAQVGRFKAEHVG